MKKNPWFLAIAFSLMLAGCASVQLNPGAPEADVLAKLGAPTHRYQDGNDFLLEYRKGPWGQTTYMARIGPDQRLISYEQVLTTEKFASLQLGKSTKNEVLRTVGAPSGTSYLSLSELEVWTYPYKQHNVWNSLMHVHFDQAGILRRMENTPDPRYEPDVRIPFSLGHL